MCCFFKQKTGYEIWYGRVGSEMCIRDRGIRGQNQRGAFGSSWWAKRWITALAQLMDAGRLARGRGYARSGQVLDLDIAPGRVAARVQGSRPAPYKVLALLHI